MITKKQFRLLEDYISTIFDNDFSGHDTGHMLRTAALAGKIAAEEGAEADICTLAAYVHDIGDHKLSKDPDKEIDKLRVFLQDIGVSTEQINEINRIVAQVSFSKGKRVPDSMEAKVVQDADRIEAVGAIGIARAFAYGGVNSQSLEGTIQHFDDKLVHLYGLLHTHTARDIAKERHAFLLQFKQQFEQEAALSDDCHSSE